MAEELQQLLEKIQKEGVEKAEAEASAIENEAKAKAEAAVKNAEEKAKAIVAKAEADAKEYAERAKETIAQGARDTLKMIEGSVSKMLERLLAQDVVPAAGDGKLHRFAGEVRHERDGFSCRGLGGAPHHPKWPAARSRAQVQRRNDALLRQGVCKRGES